MPPQGRWERADLAASLPAAYATCIRLIADMEQARVARLDAARPAAQVLAEAVAAIEAARRERTLR
jgi:hypothetical protein